jgi:hypothetical protein
MATGADRHERAGVPVVRVGLHVCDDDTHAGAQLCRHRDKMNYSGMDLRAMEGASFWSNIAVVVFGILAAIAAAFALYFGSRLGAMKDAELLRFQVKAQADIANADARAARANEGRRGSMNAQRRPNWLWLKRRSNWSNYESVKRRGH